MDTGAPVFVSDDNIGELSAIVGVQPSMDHHSLIAELGRRIHRYREFVVFHSEYVLAEYLIAYHRFNGDELVCAA